MCTMRKILLLLAIMLASLNAAFSQTKIISGKITDSTGRGVEGASVVIKGTNMGTAADGSGSFKISAKEGDVLVISAVNFSPKEIQWVLLLIIQLFLKTGRK